MIVLMIGMSSVLTYCAAESQFSDEKISQLIGGLEAKQQRERQDATVGGASLREMREMDARHVEERGALMARIEQARESGREIISVQGEESEAGEENSEEAKQEEEKISDEEWQAQQAELARQAQVAKAQRVLRSMRDDRERDGKFVHAASGFGSDQPARSAAVEEPVRSLDSDDEAVDQALLAQGIQESLASACVSGGASMASAVGAASHDAAAVADEPDRDVRNFKGETIVPWTGERAEFARAGIAAAGRGNLVDLSPLMNIIGAYELQSWQPFEGESKELRKPFVWNHDTPRQRVIAVSPDGRYLACGPYPTFVRTTDILETMDNTIDIWDTSDWKVKRVLECHASIHSLDFSRNGRYLAVASWSYGPGPRCIVIWDTFDWSKKLIVQAGDCVALSPDGRYVAVAPAPGCGYRSVGIWNTSDWSRERVLDCGDNAAVRILAFSPDGENLAVGLDVYYDIAEGYSNCETNLWNTSDWRKKLIFKKAELVSFSPDGRYFAVSMNDSIFIYNVFDWSRVALKGDRLESFAFSPDGKYAVAVGRFDGGVVIWNTVDWKRNQRLALECDYRILSLAFSPDGRYLVIGGESKEECAKIRCMKVIAERYQEQLRLSKEREVQAEVKSMAEDQEMKRVRGEARYQEYLRLAAAERAKEAERVRQLEEAARATELAEKERARLEREARYQEELRQETAERAARAAVIEAQERERIEAIARERAKRRSKRSTGSARKNGV